MDEIVALRPGDGRHVVEGYDDEYRAPSVIIATGASPARLGVPGEKELIGRGISYCATCDGTFFNGKRVAVIGGGDSALDEALYLTRHVEKITVVHRRDKLRAVPILQERAFSHPKIDFVWNSVVRSINGNGKVESLSLKDTVTEASRILEADGVFIYIGNYPNTAFLPDSIRTDNGYVMTDEVMATSVPGIFAAGDVRKNQLKQIAVAVGEAAIAATSAVKYLEMVYQEST